MSRSRTPFLVALVASLALLGAGCKQPSNTPSAYDSTTETNFVHGCTGQGSGTTLASQDACQCAYDWLVQNVPYNSTNQQTPTTIATANGEISQNFINLDDATFSSINSAIASNPDSVPQAVQNGMAKACAPRGWKQPQGSSSGGPTTSAPG